MLMGNIWIISNKFSAGPVLSPHLRHSKEQQFVCTGIWEYQPGFVSPLQCLLLGGCLSLFPGIKALVSRRKEVAFACLPLNRTIVQLHQQFNNPSPAGQWMGGNRWSRGAGSHRAKCCSRPLKSGRCLSDKRNHKFMKRARLEEGICKQRQPRPLGGKRSREKEEPLEGSQAKPQGKRERK